MKIYEAEKSVAHLLNSTQGKRSTGIYVPLKVNSVEANQDIVNRVIATASEKSIEQLANQDHPDLLYGSAILVSTVMNLNDDIFLPQDTWEARSTPIHTAFNDNHIQEDVIGHIYDARVLDQDGGVITASVAPDYFDIEVDWVVYKSIFPQAAAAIEEGGLSGEKFVSMEAVMSDFDYGLIDESGMKIVARNEETAFLTKHLRAYRGSGQYNGVTIGRVLRNFRFTGMGSVDVPANPGSVFTDVKSITNIEASDLDNLINPKSRKIFTTNKENVMFETLEQAVAAYQKLEAQNSEAVMNELKEEADAAKAEAASAAEALELEKSKVETAEQALAEANKKVEELEAAKEEAEKSLDEAQAKLDEINAQQALAGRLEALAELGVDPSEDRKAAIAKMSEEDFQSFVDWTKEVKAKYGKEGEDDMKNKNKKADDKSKAQKTEEDKAKAEEELENVEEPAAAGLETAEGEDEEERSVNVIASKLVSVLHDYNKKNPQKDK